jgi:starch synthase
MIERDDVQAVIDAVNRALDLYHERERWNQVALAGMNADHSWHNSARSYIKLYEDALRNHG